MNPRGVTLVELVVTLLILGVIGGVAGVQLARVGRVVPDPPYAALANARRRALAEGRAVTSLVSVDGRWALVTALPDGRLLADSATGLDMLSGQVARPDARGSR